MKHVKQVQKALGLLRSDSAFTLIELLVVMAIIAILVVIVIVAINPVTRVQDSNDNATQANVRSVGGLIAACIAGELGANRNPFRVTTGCADTTGVGTSLANYGTLPPTTGGSAITVIAAADTDLDNKRQICAYSDNTGGTGNVRWQSSAGDLETPSLDPALSCPDI